MLEQSIQQVIIAAEQAVQTARENADSSQLEQAQEQLNEALRELDQIKQQGMDNETEQHIQSAEERLRATHLEVAQDISSLQGRWG